MNEKNTSLSVTVDIEDWYHIPSVCGSQFSVYKDVDDFFENWKERYDYLTEPTKRVLNLLDKYKVKATFFVVADISDHYPGLIESIVDEGHEIACHGLHHECKIDSQTKKPRFTKEEFESRTKEAKNVLEKVSGQKVIGYRSPNALIGGWMIDSLEKIGFCYDSSINVNSFWNKTDSPLNGVLSNPYHPMFNSLLVGNYRKFIEFPWAYWDIMGLRIPTSGGPMLRFLPKNFILQGLKQSLDRGHTIIYFHPLDISTERFPQVGNGRPLYWTMKGNFVEKRIKKILTSFKHTDKKSLRELYEETK